MTAETIRGVIFDIDGVLEYQGVVFPGAIEAIAALRERGLILRFLTNSTLKNRQSCAKKLRLKGFQVDPAEVITASYAAAIYMRQLNPRSCWIMLEPEGLEEFQGIPQDEENPEYLVIGDNRSRFDFQTLNKALRCLRRGSKLVGLLPELVDSSLGELELNVGAWVGMLERASGTPAVYTGKPSAFAFDLALKSMGLNPRQVIMVGDRVHSDIQGAQACGIRAALVRTGEFQPEDLQHGIVPDYIFNTVSEITGIELSPNS
ncbi:MAG: HAD-IIA family hydrolase [Anaerolineaceae bacterium]|nr:HAD-IIA family hydrolase [Anaerolineaceae bacterium]